ncbi:MAG: hypothetical protein KGH50_01845, partial [Candidatus Micrarchaeota archaeon]|nr:hypothetical protein [Candidatus Micrarchaeota archaeon]
MSVAVTASKSIMLNAESVAVTNRKAAMGRSPLKAQLPTIRRIGAQLSEKSIEHVFVGGSAIGYSLPVPKAYLSRRWASNLIEVEAHARDIPAVTALLRKDSWKELNPRDFFSVTYSCNGRLITNCTIDSELLFTKPVDGRELYFAVMSMPGVFYSTNGNGPITLVLQEKMTTDSGMVTDKLIRGNRNDVRDVTNIGTVADLRQYLSSDDAVAAFRDYMKREYRACPPYGVTKVIKEMEAVHAKKPT